MKNKHVILSGLLILFIAVIIWNINKNNQLGKTFFRDFDTANMDGVILQIERGYNGTLFQLDNDSKKYVFYPYLDKKLNESNNFLYTAEKGDSIIKPAYSDTLKLIKGNKVLKYEFKHVK